MSALPLFAAPVTLLAEGLDVSRLAAWLAEIPFAEWPQQSRAELRPAMVTDPAWRGFGPRTDALVDRLLRLFSGRVPGRHRTTNRWLSAVMPGHLIEPHRDAAEPGWVRKVHVPVLTNERALLYAGGAPYHLRAGSAYLFDKTAEHAVENRGETPRVHLMFEVLSA